MTDTSGTRKFLLEMTCLLAKAEMVKQYSSAAVAFRAHSGASSSWGEWNRDSACQLALSLQGQDMHGLAFQVESSCWQDIVSMSS